MSENNNENQVTPKLPKGEININDIEILKKAINENFIEIKEKIEGQIVQNIVSNIEEKFRYIRSEINNKIDEIKNANQELARELKDLEKTKHENKLKMNKAVLISGGIFAFLISSGIFLLNMLGKNTGRYHLQYRGGIWAFVVFGLAIIGGIIFALAVINKKEG